MTQLKLYLLGSPRFERDGQAIDIPHRKGLALLAYLSVTQQPQSRDILATLLWPNSDQRRGRASLRRTLYRLNQTLKTEVLDATPDAVALKPEAKLWLDSHSFQQNVAAGLASDSTAPDFSADQRTHLTKAVDLYHDDFMSGFTLSDCHEFDEWQFFQREGLRLLMAQALEQIAMAYQVQSAYELAISYARRWLALDPLHEPVYRILMQLYAQSDQQAAALRQYDACVRMLAEELGVSPESETTTLYEAIKAQRFMAPLLRDIPQNRAKTTAKLDIEKRYHVGDQLAIGGHGEVYRGHDTETGQPVIIKRLKPGLVAKHPEFVQRFQREGELLRQLDHPNIVKVLATFEQQGQHNIVMEYVPGGSLRDMLDNELQLSVVQVVDIGLELADALSRSHHLDIIHRDIKPENVLLAADGTPRLTDFGVAHLAYEDIRLTQSGVLLGSPAYISPECLNEGVPDIRSDVWSFGILLYELLSGRPPFIGQTFTSVITEIMSQPVPPITQFRPDVPVPLVDLLQRMLAKDSQQRIDSMRQVAAELEAISTGKGEPNLNPSQSQQKEPQNTAQHHIEKTPTGDSDLAPPEAKHHLPTQPTPFVGRVEELTEIRRLLQDQTGCRLVNLVGPGGTGKTRLAVATAEAVSESFPDGVYFVGLASVSDPEFIVSAIAESLKLSFHGDTDPKTQLIHHLGQKRLCLVVDNFEHLLDGVILLSEILHAAPQVKFIATSRERFHLHEEWSFDVQGMAFPHVADEITAETTDLETYSAIELFLQSVRRADVNFTPSVDDMAHIIRICQLVEGMPLGLELAASWIRTLSCQEIAQEIERNLEFLNTNLRNIPARHRSLKAIFEQSWSRLTEQEQKALRQLAVFRGNFTREAAQHITNASLLDISSLIDKSLCRQQTNGYDMHELLRQFAFAQMDEHEQQSVQDQHSHYYGQLLATQHKHVMTTEEADMLQTLAINFDNILAAWHYIMERMLIKDEREHYAPLIGSYAPLLSIYFDRRSLFGEGQRIFHQASSVLQNIVATQTTDNSAVQNAYFQILIENARINMHQGRYQEVKASMLSLIPQLRVLKSNQQLAHALTCLGPSHLRVGEFEPAVKCLEEAIDLYDKLDLQVERASAFVYLGLVNNRRSKHIEAEGYLQEAITIYETVQYGTGLARCWSNLGSTYVRQGKIPEAIACYKRAHKFAVENNNRLWAGIISSGLGYCAYALANYQASREKYFQSLAIFRELREMRWVAVILADSSFTLIAQNDLALAADFLLESLQLIKKHQLITDGLQALSATASVLAHKKQYTQAAIVATCVLADDRISDMIKSECEAVIATLIDVMEETAYDAAQFHGSSTAVEIMIDEAIQILQE